MNTEQPSQYTEHEADQYNAVSDYVSKHDLRIFADLVKEGSTDISKANVIDVGCGEGACLRKVRQFTSGAVYGVDSSEFMLGKAESHGSGGDSSLPITYKKLDLAGASLCAGLGLEENYFDIALSTWVLCHASKISEFHDMVKNIHRALKPGGKFFGLTFNPYLTVEDLPGFLQYGFQHIPADPSVTKLTNETKLIWNVYDSKKNKLFDVEDYYYDKETIEKVFKEEGFEIVRMEEFPKSIPQGQYLGDRNNSLYFELVRL